MAKNYFIDDEAQCSDSSLDSLFDTQVDTSSEDEHIGKKRKAPEEPINVDKEIRMANNPRGCNWVFTTNNPVGKDIPRASLYPNIKRCVYQLEQGEAETPHFQGTTFHFVFLYYRLFGASQESYFIYAEKSKMLPSLTLGTPSRNS